MHSAPIRGPAASDAAATEENPLKADPFAQLQLLDVATLDARIDQLRHQLAALPEIAQLSALASEHRERADRVRDGRIRVDDLTKEQKKADLDVEQVKARRERDRSRMDAGLITNPKDLERMSHELESLERRIRTLEDEELEIMEMVEAAQIELTKAEQDLAEADELRTGLTVQKDEKTAELENELALVVGERANAVAPVPADLLALYEKIRAKEGIGAAELRGRQCGGCRLTLNPSDLSVIAKTPVDEVVRCEECTRILVRTPESGL